jgi:hypothetical protein
VASDETFAPQNISGSSIGVALVSFAIRKRQHHEARIMGTRSKLNVLLMFAGFVGNNEGALGELRT